MQKIWIWVLAVALCVACSRADSRAHSVSPPTATVVEASVASDAPSISPTGARASARRAWTPKLASEEDFLHYSKEESGERFTKFVIDLKSSAIYYIDAELYPMHKDFIFAELLKTPRSTENEHQFDANYGKNKPNFIMCYLVHHLSQDEWTLALWDGDKATAAHVRLAFEKMRESFYLGTKVKFRPNSNDQEATAKELSEIPIVTNDALYKEAPYQLFHTGVAVGTLRIVPPGATDTFLFSPDDIVILPEPLTDITPVAGILSQTFSTPLSHVNLRAASWNIPNAGLRNAGKTFANLEGKVVRFEAGDTTATMRLASPAEVAMAERSKQKHMSVIVPKANLAPTSLAPLSSLRATDASAYGSKTANLGEITHANLVGVVVPSGFGIPISYYAAHLHAAGLDTKIATMLADSTFQSSLAHRKIALESLRRDIQAAPLDVALIGNLTRELQSLADHSSPQAGTRDAGMVDSGDAAQSVGVFVRSSTSAEDLAGFSGAGLYDTVPNVRGPAAVLEAVKKVWASVWNLAAYEERALYRIDQRHVYGAVLIQLGINATGAGVLVTAHPTDAHDRNTFTINAKSGLGIRVVDGKKLPEIVLYNVFNKGLRIVSRSDEDTMLVFDREGGVREIANPTKGAPVLTTSRVAKLADAAQKLRGIFPTDRPLDIEWVFREDELFIVQSRPYMAGPSVVRPAAAVQP